MKKLNLFVSNETNNIEQMISKQNSEGISIWNNYNADIWWFVSIVVSNQYVKVYIYPHSQHQGFTWPGLVNNTPRCYLELELTLSSPLTSIDTQRIGSWNGCFTDIRYYDPPLSPDQLSYIVRDQIGDKIYLGLGLDITSLITVPTKGRKFNLHRSQTIGFKEKVNVFQVPEISGFDCRGNVPAIFSKSSDTLGFEIEGWPSNGKIKILAADETIANMSGTVYLTDNTSTSIILGDYDPKYQQFDYTITTSQGFVGQNNIKIVLDANSVDTGRRLLLEKQNFWFSELG